MPPIKAGILPFYRDADGDIHFLLQRPKPTKEEDQGKIMPFQVARGSRTLREDSPHYRVGEREEIRSQEEAVNLKIKETDLVDPLEDALREGEEELGLPREAIQHVYACGAVDYKDYGIQLYAVDVGGKIKPGDHPHSQEVAWKTVEEVRKDIESEDFKGEYLPVLQAVEAVLASEQALRQGMFQASVSEQKSNGRSLNT